ncbi:dihydrofolate reductase family protein [Chitinophaga sp. sic0106]|uniref:dihydrofolate reductase family protein n=1 Tax=Chitinophaga sp. sic0106 TaxID=2854785 RepID=UPI001C481934|nr:dihydrofolate reductase family protein [Chitinophaga sp. sic0106]MBV7530342.1 dihydrofolate reductase family protein [Chitinophaga sp. sic0106]
MRKLISFQFLTLNGYFEDAKGHTDFTTQGADQRDFAISMLEKENVLLFGRITYEHMIAWWPTPAAAQLDPEMAAGMNNADKIVFSNTLQGTAWNNTRISSGDLIESVQHLKKSPGPNLALLGSNSILTQLATHNLVDEFQLMIHPIAIGNGHTLLGGLRHRIPLQLTSTQAFSNGVVLLTYIPSGKNIPEEAR